MCRVVLWCHFLEQWKNNLTFIKSFFFFIFLLFLVLEHISYFVLVQIVCTCFELVWVRPKHFFCCVALTRPKFENWVGRSIFFFFFLRTVKELSFPIFCLKFLNGENSGGMQSKCIYKCFFRPLNTNFSKFFTQIWHFPKKKKKDPVFSHFTVGRERVTTTKNCPKKVMVRLRKWAFYFKLQ